MNWIKAQLADPSSLYHATGLLLIVGEVVIHWVLHRPVDLGAITAGATFIGGGVASDVRADRAPPRVSP